MEERTSVLEATLHEMRALIKHWEADRQCNLTPTERSLHEATETIDRVLAGGEPSRIGRMYLALAAEPTRRCPATRSLRSNSYEHSHRQCLAD